MKILTVCQGGNCRSVGLAYILKYRLNHDAMAMGWEKNSLATLNYMCRWADRVIVMEMAFVEKIPEKHRAKLSVYDVGPDRWVNSFHPELQAILHDMVDRDISWFPH